MAKYYAAPELHLGFGINPLMYPKSDMFSLGVLLAVMCTGQNVYRRAYEEEVFLEIKDLFAQYVKDGMREAVYRKIMASLHDRWQLPTLGELLSPAWLNAAPILDDLYKHLTEIDYRTRCDDFAWILGRIDKAVVQLS